MPVASRGPTRRTPGGARSSRWSSPACGTSRRASGRGSTSSSTSGTSSRAPLGSLGTCRLLRTRQTGRRPSTRPTGPPPHLSQTALGWRRGWTARAPTAAGAAGGASSGTRPGAPGAGRGAPPPARDAAPARISPQPAPSEVKAGVEDHRSWIRFRSRWSGSSRHPFPGTLSEMVPVEFSCGRDSLALRPVGVGSPARAVTRP
mmetsp:Transcript_99064/g.305309  ORF Transcript_99064/g.305309 Transcript_99064/m.305309 type:complete len:203 (-) Transcript_99064:97-705(-)